MAAIQGFISALQIAVLALAVAVTLGVTHLPASQSKADPAPPPAVADGDTTALV